MTGDLELIRRILLEVDGRTSQHRSVLLPLTLEGADPGVTAWHVEMLVDEGYVAGQRLTGEVFAPTKLTPMGHDLLAPLRQPNVWTALRAKVDADGRLPVGVLKDLALAYRRKRAER